MTKQQQIDTLQQNQEYREQQVKQAQIDVLNELKGKAKERFELTKCYTCYGDIEYEIDKLIDEVQNDTK